MALVHDRSFDPAYGQPVALADGIRRITVRNPGPFTFHGTNTYLVGDGELAVIDPGPDDPDHIAAILAVAGRARITAILVTHTHRDHSPGAARLKALTGAPTIGEGPHRPARALKAGDEAARLDASGDLAFRPDIVLGDHGVVEGAGWRLTAVATPGHAANHLAFALEGPSGVLFSGDHVMAWSTSIVAPPDGAMSHYMASLDRLAARSDRLYLPGHGNPVTDPAAYVRALKQHRLERERSILDSIGAGRETADEIVASVYAGLDPALKPAAALSVLAHVEDLAARGLVLAEGGIGLTSRFMPVA